MRTSPMARLGIMLLLLLGLTIPLTMTGAVVTERAGRRDDVARQVSQEWGAAQTIAGPVLVIPYRRVTTDSYGRATQEISSAAFLPETIAIRGQVAPEIRRRSLFPVVVYRSELRLEGQFSAIDFSHVRPAPAEILWSGATLNLGISDPRGIPRRLDVTWAGGQRAFLPGTRDLALFSTGVHTPVALDPTSPNPVAFSIDLAVNGTRALSFLPSGNETTVDLSSTWPHPGFAGAPLPDVRTVGAAGFTAAWRVPSFGRGFPQRWTSEQQNAEQLKQLAAAAAFGVTLVQPVDIYQQAERAVKYGALFIVLTFVIAFLWEITGGALVHPIQYVFVGFAMCVFYLLLLSIAEHWSFDAAYALAGIATTALIAWYWSWVMSGTRQGWVMGAALTGLYGYLYMLLRLEDVALLVGAVGLFVMLALVMFLTRRVNWFDLRLGAQAAVEER
jgi:inner membrane protein